MKDALLSLASDFLSAIVFLVIYLVTGSIIVGTAIGIAPRRR